MTTFLRVTSLTNNGSHIAKVVRETKCYYHFEIKGYYANGNSLCERVHKNTMYIDWMHLSLTLIEPEPVDLEEDKELAEVEEAVIRAWGILTGKVIRLPSDYKSTPDEPYTGPGKCTMKYWHTPSTWRTWHENK